MFSHRLNARWWQILVALLALSTLAAARDSVDSTIMVVRRGLHRYYGGVMAVAL